MPRQPGPRECGRCHRPTDKTRRGLCGACYAEERRHNPEWKSSIPVLDPAIAALVLPVAGTSETFAARVFANVDATGPGCWEWTGTKDDKGYGVVGKGGRGAGNMFSHRAVWSLLVGPIPDDLTYDHRCRNHSCCNPDHGEIVTLAENKDRGFGLAKLHAKNDYCKFGHLKDGITFPKNGKPIRYCKTCARERMRSRRKAA